MQRRQFLHSALIGAGALLPGTGVAAMVTSSIPNSITGLILPPLPASELTDLMTDLLIKDRFGVLKFLLGQGVDVNAKNQSGETLLHAAAFYLSDVEIMQYLVSVGANVNVKDDYGRAPLYSAAYFNSVEALQFLVSVGAEVNAKDNGGWTPLHRATESNSVEAMRFLVSVGADAAAKDDEGKMPLEVISEDDENAEEKKRILREAVAKQ